MSDNLGAVCRDLEILRRALTAASTPGRRPDPSTSSLLVAATLAATPRRDTATRRSVPGSRPPGGDDLLDLLHSLDRAILHSSHELRHMLGHVRRDSSVPEALDVIPRLAERVTELAARRVSRMLAEYRRRAYAALGIGRRWGTISPCPVLQPTYEAEWDERGTSVTAWWDDGVCRVYAPAVRDGKFSDQWRRSILRVDQDADPDTRDGDIVCPGCRTRWPSDQWLQLGRVLRQEADG